MKLTLATFSCRMLVLLAIASPAVFTSGRAGAATLQPETTSLNNLQSSSSDANFAASPAEKVQALLSEKQLLAKSIYCKPCTPGPRGSKVPIRGC